MNKTEKASELSKQFNSIMKQVKTESNTIMKRMQEKTSKKEYDDEEMEDLETAYEIYSKIIFNHLN